MQIADKSEETVFGSTPFHQGRNFWVTITNGSRLEIKDVQITWVHYAKSGTALGTTTETFYDVIGAGDTQRFNVYQAEVPDQTVNSQPLIRGFDFVK